MAVQVHMTSSQTISVHRADDRFQTKAGWLDSKHSFSFGRHYAPDNIHHGQLLVLNDDRVAGGTGFETHPHKDMEIVTWVVDGELEHKDSEGNRGLIYPGLAQRMSAGRGIWHSEKNWSATEDVHFIQMWVVPDTEAVDPGYQQLDVNDQLAGGGLVPIASGRGAWRSQGNSRSTSQGHDAAIGVQQREAELWAARLPPQQTVQVPEAAFGHVFIVKGSATIESAGDLATGDAVRLTGYLAPSITAGDAGAELLIWSTGGLSSTGSSL